MSGVRAAAPADTEGDRGRVVSAKVQRHWAGKRTDGDAAIGGAEEPSAQMFTSKSKEPKDPGVNRTPVAPTVIVKKEDPRLARLARTDGTDSGGARRHRHR